MARKMRAEATDGEPMFWTGGAGQPFPDDDFIQTDLSACTAQVDAPEALVR
jgi:hypothetical protein